MAIASTLVGARCKLFIDGNPVGIFTSVSYGVTYTAADIHTLGRYNAQEIVYTDMETVTVNVSGFRVMEHGPYAEASVPQLQELLTHNDITLQIVDRQAADQAKANIVTVVGVRPISYNMETSARSTANLSVTFRGIAVKDENDLASQSDTANASTYP